MNNLILYFLFCIPLRIIIYTKFKNTKHTKLASLLSLIISISFLYQFFIGNRKIGILGQPVWWNNNRLIYGIIYLIYSYYLFYYNKNYHFLILITIIYGILTYIFQHFEKK